MAMMARSFTLTCETFHLCILTLYFYSYPFLLLGFLLLDGRRSCNRPGVVGAIAVEVVRNVQIRVLVGGVKSVCVFAYLSGFNGGGCVAFWTGAKGTGRKYPFCIIAGR